MDLRSVDLNLLLALDALLEERNVTRAAERLSVGQSAMSSSLRRLRRHFGDRLLISDGKSLVPTPIAETLAPLVREAVRSADAVFGRSTGFDPMTDRRRFTIIASDYSVLILLRPLIAQLAETAPLQTINVEMMYGDYVEQIRSGDMDLGVLPAELMDPGTRLAHRYLFTDRYVLVADAENHSVGDHVTREQFAQLPYIAFDAGKHPSLADSQLDALQVERRIEMSAQSLAVLPLLVAGTQMVALAHERLARHIAAHIPLKILEPPVELRSLNETLYWSHRKTDDPAQRWLRDRLFEQASQLPTY
ncbi:MAG: LysR family transcriptional regulator [Mycobacterium sp.]